MPIVHLNQSLSETKAKSNGDFRPSKLTAVKRNRAAMAVGTSPVIRRLAITSISLAEGENPVIALSGIDLKLYK